MSSIFVKHFELPCVERCYINKLALPCLSVMDFIGVGTLTFLNSEGDICGYV